MQLALRRIRVSGLYVAWHWRYQSKSEFLAANRTQKGTLEEDSAGRPSILQAACIHVLLSLVLLAARPDCVS